MENHHIVPSTTGSSDLSSIQHIEEYIELAFQLVPVAGQALNLAQQINKESTIRLEIREQALERRMEIEREMDRLDKELENDHENMTKIIDVTLESFKLLIERGDIEPAMLLHERIIQKLSSKINESAEKFNKTNQEGQIKFRAGF